MVELILYLIGIGNQSRKLEMTSLVIKTDMRNSIHAFVLSRISNSPPMLLNLGRPVTILGQLAKLLIYSFPLIPLYGLWFVPL